MSKKLIDYVKIKSRFTRSINLEKDYTEKSNPDANYIFTPLALELLSRIIEGAESTRGTKAWSIVGPYGSGKSAFVLTLVQLFTRTKNHIALLEQLNRYEPILASDICPFIESKTFLPILVTGQRNDLTTTLYNGLLKTLNENKNIDGVRGLLKKAKQINPNDVSAVTQLYEHTANVTGGLLLVIDELGRFLEHFIHNPKRSDIYILQTLAEVASRSGNCPLLIITVLHQAFNLYGNTLTRSQRDELGKIQGRYEDLSFHQPIQDTLRLIAAAIYLSVDPISLKYCERYSLVVHEALNLSILPSTISENEVLELLEACAPLHPVVTLIIGPMFKKLAQNERSLFAFLCASEISGFQDYLNKTYLEDEGYYYIDALYDYIINACGSSLYQDAADGRKWALIQTTIDRLKNVEPLDLRVIKAIGLLNALGELGEIRPSETLLSYSLGVSDEDINASLKRLLAESAIVFRSFLRSFRLWEGSDIDLEERRIVAKQNIDIYQPIDQLVNKLLKRTPIIARRHSYMKGTFRYFDVEFISPDRLSTVINYNEDNVSEDKLPNDADGLAVFTLVEDESQLDQVENEMNNLKLRDNIIVIPTPVSPTIREVALELEMHRWIENHTPELRDDPVARREVNSRISETERTLIRLLDYAFSASDEVTVYYSKGIKHISSQRELNSLISAICDHIFEKSPSLRNELINRRILSSAAVSARRVLIESMLEKTSHERLGIVGNPPELSMYRSLLSEETTGLHRNINGEWCFLPPRDGTPLQHVWEIWQQFLNKTLENPLSIANLWADLKEPPLGLKDGVIPVLIIAMLIERNLEVSLYETGSFIPSLTTALVERLIKSPNKFQVKYCPANGIREEVFIALKEAGFVATEQPQLLPIVRALCYFANNLPQYTVKTTRELSIKAQKTRDALITAREPDKLIFESLPTILGLKPIFASSEDKHLLAKEYAFRLKTVIKELNFEYYRLLERELLPALLEALNLPQDILESRQQIIERVKLLDYLITSPKLKAFTNRLVDQALDQKHWIESIASFLTTRPPHTWEDIDNKRFGVELSKISMEFLELEDIASELEKNRPYEIKGKNPLHISLTTIGKKELRKVLWIDEWKENKVKDIANSLLNELFSKSTEKDEQLAVLVETLHKFIIP